MDPQHDVAALRGKLATEIPVTQHLGLEVLRSDASGLVLAAPLDRNVNHEGTAFAGSVNAVATLAGWGWAWLAVRREALAARLLLQDSAVEYLRPVETDFTARCLPAGEGDVTQFLAGLRRHGRGRISLQVEVHSGESLVATFRGRYVGFREGD